MTQQTPRARAFTYVTLAYVAALVVAFAVRPFVPDLDAFMYALAADVAATIVVFAFSVAFRNSSFYDPYWSVVPPVLFGYWLYVHGALDARSVIAMLIVVLWAVRLTGNWARGWPGLEHQDWRYTRLHEQTGKAYWLVSFTGIHLMPTLWVFAGCMPLYFVAGSKAALGIWDVLAAGVGIAAVWIEWRADEQLNAFRQSARPGSIIEVGWWRRSRHPNYLGEIGFWVSIALFGLGAGAPLWTLFGVASIWALFVFISIPMIEKRMLENKPDYAAYQARCRMLWPLPK